MIRLQPLVPDSCPSVRTPFALAITVSNPVSNQLHTAALYRLEDNGPLMMGDVGNHLFSRRVPARGSPKLYWVAPELTEDDQKILAAQIDAWLVENHNQIPYSVAHPGGVVFKDNVWVGDEPGQGLTCATFVVELFKELGYPFIDVSTWKQREGDGEWAGHILDDMSSRMDRAHVEAQRARIGDETIRIRPSDIAAAGHLIHEEMETSLTFEQVNPLAMLIERFVTLPQDGLASTESR